MEDNQIEENQTKCRHCGSRSETIYDREASKMTFILSILAIIFFRYYSIFLIPLIIQATRTIVKKCYDCNEVLESHDLFSIPSFNDKVLNFRFGSCAIIVSRKYAYALLILAVVLYLFLGNSQDSNLEQNSVEDRHSNRSWQQYVEDCGQEVFISNGVKAKANFIKHYDDKIVSWEGAFINLKQPENMLQQQYGIYIKMVPTDSIEGVQDIILLMDKYRYKKFQNIIEEFKQGDIIKFSGKLNHMGDEYSYHALDVESLGSTDRNINISEIPSFSEYKYQQESLKEEHKKEDNGN